jgi:phospholipid/cholesterol/gamma-HCH transport system ATP-binding protein
MNSVSKIMDNHDVGNSTVIKLRGLKKAFNDQVVLEKVDLEVHEGETVVILGSSGSGKSVLMSLIVGLLKPDAGFIRIQGEETTAFTNDGQWDQLRLKIGFLFQGSALYDSMTIGENVAFALRHHSHLSEEKIQQMVSEKLSLVELSGMENKMPSEISGGMKKRAALARAIALDPPIVLYDEPTTGLDPIRGKHITELIHRLQQDLKVTSMVVTHDLICATAVADRLALLQKGKFVFEGTARQFYQNDSSYVREFVEASTLRS